MFSYNYIEGLLGEHVTPEIKNGSLRLQSAAPDIKGVEDQYLSSQTPPLKKDIVPILLAWNKH